MDEIDIDSTLANFEKDLNFVGYIPIASSFSGALRVAFGKIEVIAGVVLGAISGIKSLFYNGQQKEQEWKHAVSLFNYSLHGIANIFRGILECIPFVSLVTCLPYDKAEVRFTYPKEVPVARYHWQVLAP